MGYGDTSILTSYIFQVALGFIFLLSFAFSVYSLVLMVKEKENIERYMRAKLFLIVGLIITGLVLLLILVTR